MVFRTAFDMEGTLEEVQAQVVAHLSDGYKVREDSFARNGKEVHRVYLEDAARYRILLRYFDDTFRGQWNTWLVPYYEIHWMPAMNVAILTAFLYECELHDAWHTALAYSA